jgi:hypothetical protein
METIEVELSDFTLRARSMLVSHVATSLARGLEPGEHVLLHDRARGHFSASVADVGFEPADTLYRIRIGVRLTDEEAGERRRRETASAVDGLTKQDVLDLLGELRSAGRSLPAAGRHRPETRTDTAL